MSSGFPGSVPEFYGVPDGISNGRSVPVNNNFGNFMQGGAQVPYGSQLSGIVPDPASQIAHRRSDLIGKRSLVEFQQQQQQLQFLQQQRQGALGLYLRNVKPRTYQQSSPISPLSQVDLSALSSISSNSNSSAMNARYGVPILQQFRPQLGSMPSGNVNAVNINGILPSASGNPNYASGFSFPNSVQNRGGLGSEIMVGLETEKKMMNRLQELEKQLLDDNDEEEGDTVSAVTNSEWSETIQCLISPAQTQTHSPIEYPNPNNKQQISPSPTSSTSSCASSMESPPITCPKQAISEAATAIAEGKNEVASEILTRLAQVGNVKGTSEQRLTAYMTSALRSRVSPVEYPPPVSELHGKEHEISTQTLYEASPCFKLGFMAANLAILDAVSDQRFCKLHVVDFDIGEGGQYLHLLYALAARKAETPTALKITTFSEIGGGDQQIRAVEDALQKQAQTAGVCLSINVISCSINELSRENLAVESDEALIVNFAFKLYKLPDESVTTENLRDELLRRVKALSPKVVTVVEQELNGNTAPFVARVNEASGYYGALFDSLDATVPRENMVRVRIEEGLGRKMANSVACEGRDRVERCEVLGKWRARLSMAGFNAMPMNQHVADSLRSKLNSGTRGNPGFTISEQAGGIGFGWMGRTLAVASAWR